MPPMVPPPGAPSLPGQVNGLPGPPNGNPPGSTALPTSSGAPSMVTSAIYQPNPAAPPSGSFGGFDLNAQAPEANN